MCATALCASFSPRDYWARKIMPHDVTIEYMKYAYVCTNINFKGYYIAVHYTIEKVWEICQSR